jgi:isopentenyl diphosphate isomerase/L-lactate dehydrogenase-like FMN-dependent dehydrogenase
LGCARACICTTVAKRRLPAPIFDYIDGAADDEVTHRRNTKAFESCDLIPRVLRGVENVDLSVTVMGQKLALPVYCSPTALQRLFHHQGERAVAAAAARYGTIGRQLDGSRASFDQLVEIVDAVGDRIDVLMDGGVQRGTHVLKALSVGAKAVGVGRYYLYPLAAAGQAGVERALGLTQTEIERDMKLMGCTAINQLSRDNLRFR